MNKKQIRDIAIVVILVFVVTIVVYPLIFGTDVKPNKGSATPVEMTPPQVPAATGQ